MTSPAQHTDDPALDEDDLDGRPALFRIAGWSSMVAGLAYLVQPLLVFVVEPEEPDPLRLAEQQVQTTIQGIEFTVVGVASIVLVLALSALGRGPGGRRTGVLFAATQCSGLIAGAAWIASGALVMATTGSVGQGLPESGADPAAQKAVLDGVYIVVTGLIGVVAIGCSVWLAGLATAGRRAGLIGLPTALLCGAVAVITGGAMFALNVPFGALLLIPTWLVLGPVLLRRARRIGH